jgi:PAS domain S-box-containing protein
MQGAGELLGSVVDLIAEFDKTGVLLQVWTGNESLLVHPANEMLGKGLDKIIGADEYHPFNGLFERIYNSGAAEDVEYSLKLADGLHWFMAHAVPVDHSDNVERTIRLFVQDFTRLRKAEEQSRKVESLLAHTQEIAKVGSWEYDTERRSFFWSEQMYRMLGLEISGDAIGISEACQLFHPEDRARVWHDVTTLLETGEPLKNELRFVTSSGENRIFFSRAIPIKDESGTVRAIRGISQDVTERRSAEINLRANQELLAQAEKIASLGSWELSAQGETKKLSENLYRIIGKDPRERPITVDEALERMEATDAGRARHNLERAMSDGAPFEQELGYRLPDGRVRSFHVRCVPMLDPDKKVTRLVGIVRDFTEQQEAQRARRESETHYRILLNSLKDHAVVTLNRHGYVTNWHNAAERMLGFSGKEALDMHFSRFYPVEDIASEKPIREIGQALREGRFEGEGWRVRRTVHVFGRKLLSPNCAIKRDICLASPS